MPNASFALPCHSLLTATLTAPLPSTAPPTIYRLTCPLHQTVRSVYPYRITFCLAFCPPRLVLHSSAAGHILTEFDALPRIPFPGLIALILN